MFGHWVRTSFLFLFRHHYHDAINVFAFYSEQYNGGFWRGPLKYIKNVNKNKQSRSSQNHSTAKLSEIQYIVVQIAYLYANNVAWVILMQFEYPIYLYWVRKYASTHTSTANRLLRTTSSDTYTMYSNHMPSGMVERASKTQSHRNFNSTDNNLWNWYHPFLRQM